MIQLSTPHRNLIEAILKKYPYTFYAFGSRVKGTAKPFSDLDLCFKSKIPMTIRAQIDAEFEESDLPFKVDLISWAECSEAFQKHIASDMVVF